MPDQPKIVRLHTGVGAVTHEYEIGRISQPLYEQILKAELVPADDESAKLLTLAGLARPDEGVSHDRMVELLAIRAQVMDELDPDARRWSPPDEQAEKAAYAEQIAEMERRAAATAEQQAKAEARAEEEQRKRRNRIRDRFRRGARAVA